MPAYRDYAAMFAITSEYMVIIVTWSSLKQELGLGLCTELSYGDSLVVKYKFVTRVSCQWHSIRVLQGTVRKTIDSETSREHWGKHRKNK